MNLVSGRIEEIHAEEATMIARVNVRGVFIRVPLTFLPVAQVGDTILIESGVAISKVKLEPAREP